MTRKALDRSKFLRVIVTPFVACAVLIGLGLLLACCESECPSCVVASAPGQAGGGGSGLQGAAGGAGAVVGSAVQYVVCKSVSPPSITLADQHLYHVLFLWGFLIFGGVALWLAKSWCIECKKLHADAKTRAARELSSQILLNLKKCLAEVAKYPLDAAKATLSPEHVSAYNNLVAETKKFTSL